MITTIKKSISWAKKNLFSTWYNILISILLIIFLFKAIINPFIEWGIVHAVLHADSNQACLQGGSGACWGFISSNIGRFIYGLYPIDQRWRIDIIALLVIFLVGPIFSHKIPNPPGIWKKPKVWLGIIDLTLLPLTIFILLKGGIFGLTNIDTHLWGGLTLTLLLGSSSIVIALPLSIFLALGRRSKLPIIKLLCVMYIEFIRAVPLITLLFMATTMLPLLVSANITINNVISCIIAIIMFSSAYYAEVIRAGLEGVEKGQYDASQALGLSYWQSRCLIILPQALTITLPNLVNTTIGLFKDTSLVYIVGLFDLLGMVETTLSDPNWLARYIYEGFLFVAIIFFILCFGLSKFSDGLEKRLNKKDTTI